MRRAFSFVTLICALLIPVIRDAEAGYRMKISFAGYTNRVEALTNFPVLVTFSNNIGGSGFDFAGQPFASTNGVDLRFTSAAGDAGSLNYEIESWNTGAACHVWVQIPALRPDGSGCVWAKWGADSNRLSCTTNGSTWSGGYVFVSHDGGKTDSSQNHANGTGSGGVSGGGAAGIAGAATDFDGTDDYLNIPYSPRLDLTTQLTVSAWVNPDSLVSGDYTPVIQRQSAEAQNQDSYFLGFNSASRLHFGSYGGNIQSTRNNAWTGMWHCVSATYLKSGSPPYPGVLAIDGNNEQLANSSLEDMAGTSNSLRIGRFFTTVDRYFDGRMDEIRLSDVVRSTNWDWADFQTVASNTLFTTYGLPERDPAPAVIASPGATGVTTRSAWLGASLVSTGAASCTWGLVWGTNNPGQVMDGWSGGGVIPFGTATAENVATSFLLTALTDGRIYNYAAWATNQFGSSVSQIGSFRCDVLRRQGSFEMPIYFSGYSNRTAILTNFPVPIFFSNGMSGTDFDFSRYPFAFTNGADLRFRSSGGQVDLNYEIERWDTGSCCLVWLQVPQLPPDGSGVVFARWGRAVWGAKASLTNGSVWTNGYTGVWHMEAAAAPEPDSTTNRSSGVTIGAGQVYQQQSPLAGAIGFTQSGGNGGLVVADRAQLDCGGSDFTVETWFRKAESSSLWSNTGGVGKWWSGVVPGSNEWLLSTSVTGDDDRPEFAIESGVTLHACSSPASIQLNEWYHIAGVREGSSMRIYVNGLEKGSAAGVSGSVNNVGRDMHFGYFPGGPSQSPKCRLDEVRISSVARSGDWLWASWMGGVSNSLLSRSGPVVVSGIGAVYLVH